MATNSGIHVLPICATSGVDVADIRGQQLLVRRVPRDLLHDDMDVRIAPLELRHQLRDDLALAAEGPEVEAFAVVAGRAAQPRRSTSRTTNVEC